MDYNQNKLHQGRKSEQVRITCSALGTIQKMPEPVILDKTIHANSRLMRDENICYV